MHILLMSCSSKKNNTGRPIPAIDLYNGVFFSVYKKAIKAFPNISSKIKVLIISAKYGLIEASHPTVSENGFHCGVCFNGIVYCNIHPFGLPEDVWINDFVGFGIRTVAKIPF